MPLLQWPSTLVSEDGTLPDYNPDAVDWASVVSACRAVCQQESRMASWFIRAAFHDALSLDAACLDGSCAAYGNDGSLLLSLEEMLRPENAYDEFSEHSAKPIKMIAAWYGASIADTLAVSG